jgi:hypothetical protein
MLSWVTVINQNIGQFLKVSVDHPLMSRFLCVSQCSWKWSLNNDGQQFNQYQQNELICTTNIETVNLVHSVCFSPWRSIGTKWEVFLSFLKSILTYWYYEYFFTLRSIERQLCYCPEINTTHEWFVVQLYTGKQNDL